MPDEWPDTGGSATNLTIRDTFAALAMQALMSVDYDEFAACYNVDGSMGYEDQVATISYSQSDAMLRARKL